jgi:hypothetical protein
MRITALISLSLALLSSCAVPHNKQKETLENFRKEFTELPAMDTIYISYWHYWKKEGCSPKGTRLDNKLVLTAIDTTAFFRSDFYKRYSLRDFEFYALYRFPLSDSIEAYILRAQNGNIDQKTDIFLYDKNTMSFIREVEVAELIGGEGGQYELNSLLVDIDKDGAKDLISLRSDEVFSADSASVQNTMSEKFTFRKNTKRDFEEQNGIAAGAFRYTLQQAYDDTCR